MGELYVYNTSHLTIVRPGSVELTQTADNGGVGEGQLALDDTAGTQSVIGHKDFSHTESACSVPLTFRGFMGPREYGRDAGTERKPHLGASRGIGLTVRDLNAVLRFRQITATNGKRPAETVSARMAWLLASHYLSGLVIDNGRIAASSQHMDKADYMYQYAGDVLADMVLAARGFNHHVQDYGSGPELIFRNDNTSTADSSTLRISNVNADVDSGPVEGIGATKTFGPSKDAVLRRNPDLVWSELAMAYSQGTVVKERTATATAFNGERGGNASNVNIKTAAAAATEASHQLVEHSTEADIIELAIEVPAAAVNLLLPGFRVQAKFSHLATEGYGSFTWFRVLERKVKPLTADGAFYRLGLKLSPQEGTSAPACAYDATEAGTFYPLGDQPPTGPSEWYAANVSDGVVYYLRPGIFYPTVPTPGAESQWHFIAHVGAGGAGSIDYAGDCVQNVLQFIVVGPGTLTVQTEIYGGTRPMAGSWGESPDAYANSIGTFTSGDEVTFTVTGECANIIRLYDGPGSPCGGKWGWSVAEWVPA